jgi:RNA-dependent RNA polymerase
VQNADCELTHRDHAIWFIDAKAIDGLKLRRWMGNVEEQVVAKHAARMGLVSC